MTEIPDKEVCSNQNDDEHENLPDKFHGDHDLSCDDVDDQSNTISADSKNTPNDIHKTNLPITTTSLNENEPTKCSHSLAPGPSSDSVSLRPHSITNCSSNTGEICRICHGEAESDAPLISPCICSGSLKYVHQSCLQQWIKSSDTRYCELCKFEFVMKITTKPFNEWKLLDMSPLERRKIICSVSFHTVALTCVIWALYVLIERTTEEINHGELDWPFWTKLIVVAVGFTGGVVFMYVQCRMYSGLCKRWRSFNRIFLVQNIPEDLLEKSQKAAKEKLIALQYASSNKQRQLSQSQAHQSVQLGVPLVISSSICTLRIQGEVFEEPNCEKQCSPNVSLTPISPPLTDTITTQNENNLA